VFESLDRPALRPLPAQPYEYAEWKLVRVNIDYHVEVRIGKSNGIFTSVSTGAHPRSPRRLDATAPRCPTACACKAARWLWRATSAMADAAPSAWPAFFGLPHPR